MRPALILTTLLLAATAVKTTVADPASRGAGEANAAWSEPGKKGADIFYAEMENGRWGSAVRISGGGVNITPALTEDSEGNIWVVWIERRGEKGIESVLKYSVMRGRNVTRGRVLHTSSEHSYAPSIIVDNSDTPWLAWAIFDGNDEDIYFSRWQGGSWDVPVRVNYDDTYPDVTPVIALGKDGQPWVAWRGYDGDQYRQYQSRWLGNRWSRELIVDESNTRHVAATDSKNPLALPDRARGRLMGAIHVPNGGEIQSRSELFFSLGKKAPR